MDKLRLTLLIIGLVVIAGIYLWGTVFDGVRRPRNRRVLPRPAQAGDEEPPDEHLEFDPEPRGEEEESFIDQALTDLNQLVRESRGQADIDGPIQLDAFVDGGSEDDDSGSRNAEPVSNGESAAPSEYRDIIALFVVAPEGTAFAGAALRESLANLGMRFGDMNIFHHFGDGKLASREPIFSLASMLEPGSFDLAELDNSAVRGVALFMRVPGPVDGRVAFELMLSTAERLKLELGGEVHDEHHRKLTLRQTERLRERAGALSV